MVTEDIARRARTGRRRETARWRQLYAGQAITWPLDFFVPVRGYAKGGDADNVEFVDIAA
jgi:hypothetical protein